MNRSLAAALPLIEKRSTLAIIDVLRDGPIRSAVIHERVDGSAGKLNERLAFMLDIGLISRRRYREVPPRVMYELTDLGRCAISIVDELKVFGELYLALNEAGPPVQ